MFRSIIKQVYIILIFSFGSTVMAQTSFSGGADFVSRYLWRGLDFGNTFSLQPTLAFSSGNFEAGFWGSYPFTNTAGGNEEMDLYFGYSYSNFSILITDYYFPNSGKRYGLYEEPGAHTIEVGLSYGGSDSFPISLAAFMNVHNDDDNTVYFEVGYSTEVNDVNVDLFVGGTPGGDGGFYGPTELNLINIGISVSKEISISNEFALPIFTSYVLNPNLEKGYLLFGLSLNI